MNRRWRHYRREKRSRGPSVRLIISESFKTNSLVIDKLIFVDKFIMSYTLARTRMNTANTRCFALRSTRGVIQVIIHVLKMEDD